MIGHSVTGVVYIFIKMPITAHSGPVTQVVLCHSHGGINDIYYKKLCLDATKGTHSLYLYSSHLSAGVLVLLPPPAFLLFSIVCSSTLTDRASTIPSNIRGCQSGTWSARQENIRGTLQRSEESIKTRTKQKKQGKKDEI